MPYANFKFPQGMMTPEQKAEIVHRTTDMFAEYFGDGVRPYTMVLVDEVVDGGFGRAGEVFDLKALAEMKGSDGST